MESRMVQTDFEYLPTAWEEMREAFMEESACAICLDYLTTTPDHRVTALKCGHIFGDGCIRRWLSENKSEGGPSCPNCKAKTKLTDLRYITPRTLRKADLEAIAKLRQEVETARQDRVRVETEVKALKEKAEASKAEYEVIKKLLQAENEEYKRLRDSETETLTAAISQPIQKKAKIQPLVRFTTVPLTGGTESRVFTVSDMYGLIIVGQKKESNLFPPYGLRIIGTGDLQPKEFIPLHRAQIKDAAFHPFEPHVLTASLDKTVTITNILDTQVIRSFHLEDAAWSCCWNEINPDYFFVGLKNGTVHEYNTDLPGRTSREIQVNDKTPCGSLTYIHGSSFSGVVSSRLRSSDFHFLSRDSYLTQSLSVSGNVMSSHFDRLTKSLMFSSRPFKNQSRINHSVYKISPANCDIEPARLIACEPYKTFYGGVKANLVMRSKIFPHPNDETQLIVCAGDQDIAGFTVWDTVTDDVVQKIGGITPVFDFAQINQCNSSKNLIVALTEKQLYFYEWRYDPKKC